MDSAFKVLLVVAALVAGLWWWLRRKAATAAGEIAPPPAEIYSRGPTPTGMAAATPTSTYAGNVIVTPTIRGTAARPPAGVPNSTPATAARPMFSMGSTSVGSLAPRGPAPVGVA